MERGDGRIKVASMLYRQPATTQFALPLGTSLHQHAWVHSHGLHVQKNSSNRRCMSRVSRKAKQSTTEPSHAKQSKAKSPSCAFTMYLYHIPLLCASARTTHQSDLAGKRHVGSQGLSKLQGGAAGAFYR